MRICVVDDDPSVRRGLSRLLKTNGFFCLVHDSAEAALADPQLNHVDCIILDIQLSGTDGFSVRDRLRKLGTTIPIVFITGYPQADSPEWMERLGNTPFLTKPFEEKDLMSMLSRLLNGWPG